MWGRSVFVALCVASQGWADAQWEAPQEIGQFPASEQVSAAISTKGDGVVVYNRYEWSEEEGKYLAWVEASTTYQGIWQTQALTEKTDPDFDTYSVDPQVAIDKRGFSYVLWRDFKDGQQGVKSALHPNGFLSWISDIPMPCTLANTIEQYEIAVDKDGVYATALWSVERGGKYFIEGAQFNQHTIAWTALEPISLTKECKYLDLKIDPQGTAWLIWSSIEKGDEWNLYVTSLKAGRTQWKPAEVLTTGRQTWEPALFVDREGNLLAQWQKVVGKHPKDAKLVFEILKKAATSSKWKKTKFPTLNMDLYTVGKIDFDRKGNALMIWDDNDNRTNNSALPKGSLKWGKRELIKKRMGPWASGVNTEGNRLLAFKNVDDVELQVMTLEEGSNKWSTPSTVTPMGPFHFTDDVVYGVGVYGNGGLIIYKDENSIKAVRGTRLFK